MKEGVPGSARRIEEQWVSKEKELDDDQKKSLRFIKAFFFENSNYQMETPEYIVDQSAKGQIRNMQEGATAILQADKEEVMKALGIQEEQDWNRCFSAALEINKRWEELEKSETESDSESSAA